MLCRIRLVEFVLELSDQIVLRVHDIQVLILVPVPFVLLILTGATDVVENLPQFVTLDWPCGKHISVINMRWRQQEFRALPLLQSRSKRQDYLELKKTKAVMSYSLI